MTAVRRHYAGLLVRYGPQGWWPLLSTGYRPGDYSHPASDLQRFEVAVGAVLTQNTAWTNVEKALAALGGRNAIEPKKLARMPPSRLCSLIRPAGYFNQKARKLKELSGFWLSLDGAVPSREELLGVWGIGPETADSILLYAFHEPEFVVDAYARRIGQSLGWLEPDMTYDEVKAFFEERLPKDVPLYQEYHALLVEEGKRLKRLRP